MGKSWSVLALLATAVLERTLSSCKPIFRELIIVGNDLATVMMPAKATAPAPM